MAVERVVVLIQENKTVDFLFTGLQTWGADVHRYSRLRRTAPNHDQPHDRSAWVHYAMGDHPGLAMSLDTDHAVPFYSWLAKMFTFCDHHVGLGSNSTPGHMTLVGGQTRTLKNPPFSGPHIPTWDLPSIFGHAQANGVSWAAFVPVGGGESGYPTHFYTQLADPAYAKNIHAAEDFVTQAAAGRLPQLTYAWAPAGSDEHPPQKSDPAYLRRGQDLTWQRVQAVVDAGQWESTVFVLTYDDRGGYADHVVAPAAELVPDELHPDGFRVIGGSRLPLLMFGGAVAQGIESGWHSMASVPRTLIDLLGLPAFGVDRVDTAPSLAGRVVARLSRPAPPAFGSVVVQPAPPAVPPAPVPPGDWPGPLGVPMPPLVTLSGGTLPAPTDGHVKPRPPPTPRR